MLRPLLSVMTTARGCGKLPPLWLAHHSLIAHVTTCPAEAGTALLEPVVLGQLLIASLSLSGMSWFGQPMTKALSFPLLSASLLPLASVEERTPGWSQLCHQAQGGFKQAASLSFCLPCWVGTVTCPPEGHGRPPRHTVGA